MQALIQYVENYTYYKYYVSQGLWQPCWDYYFSKQTQQTKQNIMLKYYITIVERTTKTVQHLIRGEQTIDQTVEKELGGWTTHSAMTSGVVRHDKEFFQAGTTKDNLKCFSILAVWEESDEELESQLNAFESTL